MKRKAVSGITLTLLLMGILTLAFNIQHACMQVPIKVGVIGPMEWIQGQGMKEASILAAEEINDAGGVLGRELVIVTGDEGFEPAVGVASMEKLITVDDVDFVVGGFRTEIVFPMRDKAMDHQKIFIITGAATNELLDCTGSLTMPNCGHCLSCDYNRYKYLFRVMPINTTAIFSKTLLPYIRYHVIPNVLGGGPDKTVKVGVLVENLVAWDLVWNIINFMPSAFTGPYGRIVYKAHPSHTETDFTTYLSEMRDQGVDLIIHLFSGEAGLAFIKQWAEMEIPAIPVGINVLSQETATWTDTEGKCEYEVFISSPPRANVSARSLAFWDAYVDRWGHDPISTSWGTYDAVYTLAEAVERAGTIDSDAVVAELEETDRTSTIGRFKFTQYHDVFSPLMWEGVGESPTGTFRWKTPEELGWPNTWVLPMIVQWIDSERVPVFPFGFPYTERLRLPPGMDVCIAGDVDGNGKVNYEDLFCLADAYGSHGPDFNYPGEPASPHWDKRCDINGDNSVNPEDFLILADHYGMHASKFKIAVVSDVGGRGDLGFNDMAFKGGEEAEEDFNVQMVEIISKVEADYVPNLEIGAKDPNVELIVGVGFLLSDALADVARRYPDKNFAGIDTYAQFVILADYPDEYPLPNLMDITYEEHKGSALVGALGALLASYYQEPYIGMVLGMEIPALYKYEIGYKWGCDWAVNWLATNHPELDAGIVATPKKERVLWTYTGTFSDITKGYTSALPMYEAGAVAVYNVAGPLGLGINAVVRNIAETEWREGKRGRPTELDEFGPPFWIGVDANQDWINPGFIIASTMKRVDRGVYYATELVHDDIFRDVVADTNGAITLGIGTEVAGALKEGISVSTLADLDEFIDMGLRAEEMTGEPFLPGPRDWIKTKVEGMREAQPSWIWDAIEELEDNIRTGTIEVPLADTQDAVDSWRDILG